MAGTGERTFAHPWRIAAVLVAVGAVAWAIAAQAHVSQPELDLTIWLNDLPASVAYAIWPVMQVGSLTGPFVAAGVVLVVARDLRLAAAVVIAGLVAWYLAKVVKDGVERGRPFEYSAGIQVRGRTPGGFGFVSGHAAVSMATVVVLMACVPRRWRGWLLLVPLVVGLARMIVGVHLPADVVGGWALGGLVGLATVEILDRLRPRRSEP